MVGFLERWSSTVLYLLVVALLVFAHGVGLW